MTSATGSFQRDATAECEFERLLVQLMPRLRAFARTLVRNQQDGDDLAQAAALKAWRARGTFEPGTDLTSWGFRILRNEHISLIRAARRTGEHVPDGATHLAARDDQHAALEAQDVWRALHSLPPQAREALLLIGAAGLSYRAAAAVIGCPVGTVKARVFRARAALLSLV